MKINSKITLTVSCLAANMFLRSSINFFLYLNLTMRT